MKVAVSIPDDVFRSAERVAKRLRVPRSQLYTRALEAYVREQSGAEITRALNEIYSDDSASTELLDAPSLEILRREKW